MKGYEAVAWIGIGAPKGTPPEIIATLNKQINAAVPTPRSRSGWPISAPSAMPPMTPAEFGKIMAEDIAKWAKVIKSAGIKPE